MKSRRYSLLLLTLIAVGFAYLFFNFANCAWPIAENGELCRSECIRKPGSQVHTCATRSRTSSCDPNNLEGNGDLVLTNTQQLFCVTDCNRHGYSYDWCFTSRSWDYCDPNNKLTVPQHITRMGEYCTGPCTKKGNTEYFWCERWDSWDYCSPDFGETRYELRCKSSHPCAKHDGKAYYWCYVEQNGKNWFWDYCSPPFDANEPHQYENFDGNFGLNDIPEKVCPVEDAGTVNGQINLERRSIKENWTPLGSSSRDRWPTYPNLYRILAIGQRNTDIRLVRSALLPRPAAFLQIESRSLNLGQERPTISLESQVQNHVGRNPDYTPWISTSFNLRTQECMIRNHLNRNPNAESVYLAVIDADYLGERIVNLGHQATRYSLLGQSQASRFAQGWDEVLIYWKIRGSAIRSIRRYMRNTLGNIYYQEIPNPGYGRDTPPSYPVEEDFDDL